MKQRKKIRDGIGLYPPSKHTSNSTGSKKTSPFLLASLQLLAVWFLVLSWWQSLTSVLPIHVDTALLYLICFCFTAILVFLGNSPIRAIVKFVLLLLLSCLAGIWVLKHTDAVIQVINLTANAWLEVFKPEANPYPLQPVSAPQTALMSAIFLLPLLLLWYLILRIRRGKLFAMLLLLAPAVFILAETQVPSEISCWLLILSGAFYCTVCGCREGHAALAKGVSATCMLALLVVLSAAGSRPLEPYKEPADGFYAHTRENIKAGVITPLQDSYAQAKAERDEKKAAQKQDTDAPRSNAETEQTETAQNEPEQNLPDSATDTDNTNIQAEYSVEPSQNAPDTPLFPTENNTGNDDNTSGQDSTDQAAAGQNPSGTGNGSADTFPDLNALSYFQPDTGTRLTLTMDSKPEETVYYPSAYGIFYDNSHWYDLPADSDIQPEAYYRQLPQGLDRLKALCQENAPQTLADTSHFIEQEFEEHTVYDFQPGITPSGQDFAEYFLFENQKGFCVHFATTAVLMYRFCGYPARYVQGYAIPASAFHRQEDGRYTAEVTGEMGHAWCEVSEDGEWVLKEHTLPYYGVRPETGIPAASSSEHSWKRSAAGWGLLLLKVCAAAVAGLLVLVIIFFAQAALRRQHKYRRFRTVRHGAGIQRMYCAIYDTAVFRGMEQADILSSKGFHALCGHLPEIPADALEWLYQTVLESMFYQKKITKDETRRALQIYQQFSRKVKKELTPSQKFIYNYIKIM